MSRTFKFLTASVACCALLPAAGQSAANFVDAANFIVDTTANNLVIGGQKLAQTLTVEMAGDLAGAFLPVACGTGRLIVEVRDVVSDQPGPTVLAQRTVDSTAFDTGGRFTFVRLGPLALVAGQRIAITLANNKGICVSRQSTAASNYPGGQAFFVDADPNFPRWVPFSEFVGPDDLPFQLVLQ
jgi:hypothetical protein